MKWVVLSAVAGVVLLFGAAGARADLPPLPPPRPAPPSPPPPPPPNPPTKPAPGTGPASIVAGVATTAGIVLAGLWLAGRSRRRIALQS